MNMVSIGIPLFIFTVSCITANKGFVTVKCKTENMGQFGQKSLLECVVTTTQEATVPQIRVVTWKKVGIDEPLVVFFRGDTIEVSGYSFAEPSWNAKNMNVSLLITNTTLDDEGDYTCAVMTSWGSASSSTSLKVRAPSFSGRLDEDIDRHTVTPLATEDGGSSLMSDLIIVISVLSTLVTVMTILLILLGMKLRTRNREKTTCVQKVLTDDLMNRNDLDSVGALGHSMPSLYDF